MPHPQSLPTVVPVVLAGGVGTRLWPLSRELTPKQLLPLVTKLTLLQETVKRTQALRGAVVRAPIVVCNGDHRLLVAEQLRALGVTPEAILLEPRGRNTAPAVALAALSASAQRADSNARAQSLPADPLLLVLSADHVIADVAAFAAAFEAALDAAVAGRLVTFGVVPTRPETGYGYLLRGRAVEGWFELERFVEKPDPEAAERYVASGRYLWNSGMFVFSARRYVEELRLHAPDILAACERSLGEARLDGPFTRVAESFAQCRSDSIDYAVMEKTDAAAVVALDAGWSDVGSWDALHDVVARDFAGNAVRGDVLLENCKDSYVAATSRLVVAVGLDGVVVVETPDAVLVMPRSQAQAVKAVVERLRAAGRDDLVRGVASDRAAPDDAAPHGAAADDSDTT